MPMPVSLTAIDIHEPRCDGVNGATPNSAAAVVEKVEFLGAFSRITFRLEGIDQPLTADLSLNDMAEFAPRPGARLRIAVPPDRMRVFA